MGHKIIEAVIENGRIKYASRSLPRRRMKVHLIYDTEEQILSKTEAIKLVQETSGIYKGIDVHVEADSLRGSWERNVHE